MKPLGCSDVAGGASTLEGRSLSLQVGVRQPDPREEEPCDIQGGGQSWQFTEVPGQN